MWFIWVIVWLRPAAQIEIITVCFQFWSENSREKKKKSLLFKMANNIHKLAKEALDNGNYQLAVELFECIFQISDKLSTMSATTADDPLLTIDTYIGYGDSLARCGRMHESFDVFVFICTQLGYAVPLDKLKQLTIGLLESVASTTPSSSPSSASSSSSPAMAEAASTTTPVTRRHSSHSVASHTDDAIDAIICGGSKNKCDGRQGSLALERSLLETNKCCNDIDPFACPVCYDVLVLPVTIACGHTYCRDCIYDQSHCYVCGKALQVYGNKFKQDVLIGRLIEKWWSPMLQARAHNDEAEMWLRQNALDQALKSSNASLEKCKYNTNDVRVFLLFSFRDGIVRSRCPLSTVSNRMQLGCVCTRQEDWFRQRFLWIC